MLVTNFGDPQAKIPTASTPVKFKSVQKLYSDNADDSSRTDSDEFDPSLRSNHQKLDEWSDSLDDEDDDDDDSKAYPTGRKEVAYGQLVRRKVMSITQNQVFESSYIRKEPKTTTFKTLAQLIEPRANEKVKSFTKQRKAFLAKKITARKRGPKPGQRRPRNRNLNDDGGINLIVDLVFQKTPETMPPDGLSSSSSTVVNVVTATPLEDGLSAKFSSQDSVNQDGCLDLDEEEQCNAVTITDPSSLTTARFFTNHVASTVSSAQSHQLKWREVDVSEADPSLLCNRMCKVFFPLENKWCKGAIKEHNQSTRKFKVVYDGGEEKWHCLAKERLALYLSLHEKSQLLMGSDGNFNTEKKPITENLLVLAADTEDSEGVFGHGDIVWAEDTGYPFWPAYVMDESHASSQGLEMCGTTLPVQFFGSYECVRVNRMRVVEFSRGLQRSYHLKCKRVLFDRALDELDRYFRERFLPQEMVHLLEDATGIIIQNGGRKQSGNNENEDFVGDERKYKVRKSLESIFKCPIKLGALRVLNLGKIVKDSEYFHDQHYIWTEGYTAMRRFSSTKDPTKMVNYKMEVLKNPILRTMPLFRVTPEDGEQVEGSSAAICWKKIFDKLQKAKGKLISNVNNQGDKRRQQYRSGPAMFGFTHPRVSRLIQALPYARVCSKYKAWAEATASEELDGLLPAGFKHVEGDWKHLDRCSVCYTNEEYEGNVLLQCDQCRMLVHLNCYGVLEPPGDSWLCNLCELKVSPPCCLCPIQGGAMKRTTDGRWVHLACALWIPETCCVDMDRMEPIDGIQCINKERWKLTCTICHVPYGTCIQCADHHCRVAYHPLCARAAGFCTKVLEGLRRKRNQQTGAHEEERSVQLLSYCKKHMQGGRSKANNRDTSWTPDDYSHRVQNHSGCARSEPYNVAVRRGRREPEQYAAALAKRSFLENRPYIVTGCLRQPYKRKTPPSAEGQRHPFLTDDNVPLSMSQRFSEMRATVHRRLTFGKSAIHGWGLFAKESHRAGDMVIEYAGEVIRPVVADVREKSCYNSLVGAGTYMFCIDDERVIDATRSGSIAHLINHSCEPNCYSRVVAARGKDRIIIFAKQDISGGEEVTYDYRFTSMGEQLACHCGTNGCRGIVNVMDEDDQSGKILVNASEVTRFTSS